MPGRFIGRSSRSGTHTTHQVGKGSLFRRIFGCFRDSGSSDDKSSPPI
jgi:hypothetical protein